MPGKLEKVCQSERERRKRREGKRGRVFGGFDPAAFSRENVFLSFLSVSVRETLTRFCSILVLSTCTVSINIHLLLFVLLPGQQTYVNGAQELKPVVC